MSIGRFDAGCSILLPHPMILAAVNLNSSSHTKECYAGKHLALTVRGIKRRGTLFLIVALMKCAVDSQRRLVVTVDSRSACVRRTGPLEVGRRVGLRRGPVIALESIGERRPRADGALSGDGAEAADLALALCAVVVAHQAVVLVAGLAAAPNAPGEDTGHGKHDGTAHADDNADDDVAGVGRHAGACATTAAGL